MQLRLRNIGAMVLHGRHPGEEWTVEAGDDGKAVNQLWRKRLADEERYNVGVLAILGMEPAGIPSPDPVAAQPSPDIGPFLDLFGALAARVDVIERRPQPVSPPHLDTRLLSQQIQQPLNDQYAILLARVEALEGTIKAALAQ